MKRKIGEVNWYAQQSSEQYLVTKKKREVNVSAMRLSAQCVSSSSWSHKQIWRCTGYLCCCHTCKNVVFLRVMSTENNALSHKGNNYLHGGGQVHTTVTTLPVVFAPQSSTCGQTCRKNNQLKNVLVLKCPRMQTDTRVKLRVTVWCSFLKCPWILTDRKGIL